MGAAQSPSLNDATKLVLFVFAIIVSTFAIGLLVFVCHRQRRRNRSNVPNSSGPAAYAPVAHQLDDEEIEFKKMLETQSDGIEGILGDDVDDLVFDSQDFARLRQLDKYRDRLKAESEHNINSSISTSNNGTAAEEQSLTSIEKENLSDDLRV